MQPLVGLPQGQPQTASHEPRTTNHFFNDAMAQHHCRSFTARALAVCCAGLALLLTACALPTALPGGHAPHATQALAPPSDPLTQPTESLITEPLLAPEQALGSADQPQQSPWARLSQGAERALPWEPQHLPGKAPSRYRYAYTDARHALLAQADSSASLLRQKRQVPASQLGQVRFSWKVPALIANADMALRDADDSPVRLLLVFDGDRSRFSMKDAMLSELAQTLTGEPMPYATLMYVWCNKRAPGSVIINPRTDRIRKLVVESGTAHLNQWRDYDRQIAADFEQAFGEPPGNLLGIGLMTDTDNTRSHSQAWYGPVTLVKP